METPATGPIPETLSTAIQVLLRGQDSAKKLRDLLSAVSSTTKPLKEEEDGTAEDLVGDVLRSFTSTLSILNCGDSDGDVSQGTPASRCTTVKSEESEESSKSSAPRDRRGCYKRRRSSDSWTTTSPNFSDDGHQWRKYGQKSILNTNFPRSYFRCTHKLDQGCQATKQVQKVSDDPPSFRTIYHRQHTCRNLLKAPQIILADDLSPRDSSILVSFKTNKSTDTTNSSANIPFLCSPFASSIVKREGKEEIVAMDSTNVLCNQSHSSEYDNFPSPNFTGLESTIRSDQGEALSSTYSFDDNNMDQLVMSGVDLEDILTYFPQ